MKLSSRARHAVRLVLEVSRLGGKNKPVQLSKISEVTGLSRKFLEQLAISLKSHALLRGVSGRNGGYVLAKPPEKITIGDVLVSAIGPIDLTICAEDPTVCMSSEFCECRLVWALLRDRINAVLNEYTIADLLNREWMDSLKQTLRGVDLELDSDGEEVVHAL